MAINIFQIFWIIITDFFFILTASTPPQCPPPQKILLKVLPGYIYSLKGVRCFKKESFFRYHCTETERKLVNKFTIYPYVIEGWRSFVYKKFYKAKWYLPSSDGLWSGGVLRNLFWSPFPPDLKLDGRFSCILCHLCLSFRKRDKV